MGRMTDSPRSYGNGQRPWDDVMAELAALSEPEKLATFERLKEEHDHLLQKLRAIPRPPRSGKGSRTQRKPYDAAVKDINDRIHEILWMQAVVRKWPE